MREGEGEKQSAALFFFPLSSPREDKGEREGEKKREKNEREREKKKKARRFLEGRSQKQEKQEGEEMSVVVRESARRTASSKLCRTALR